MQNLSIRLGLAVSVLCVVSSSCTVNESPVNRSSQGRIRAEQVETIRTQKSDVLGIEDAVRVDGRPTGLTIPVIDVDHVAVQSVGVVDDGSMALPDFDAAGWYEFGPSPGDTGSAVIAGHIAFDDQVGVFATLDQLVVGDQIVVHYSSSEQRIFRVEETTYYDKESLPTDTLFGRSGEPMLTLITCGGSFNPGLLSYRGNVVVRAKPI